MKYRLFWDALKMEILGHHLELRKLRLHLLELRLFNIVNVNHLRAFPGEMLKMFCLMTLMFSGSCETKPEPTVDFYYWKSERPPNAAEAEIFSALNSKKLYVRLFDVDLQQGNPAPQGILANFNKEILPAEYVPVVFITNRTFLNISEESLDNLATKVSGLTDKIMSDHFGSFKELQIDCDWTESTKTSFFSFLEKLKDLSDKNISCTLRLHQVKYKEKTGVPPVDKTYLMAYATSNPLGEEEINSILDISLLKNYLENINEYPLDFDVALPLYSWAVVTNHLGKKLLINGVSENDLNPAEYMELSPGNYELEDNVFLRGIYLNRGFKLKLETVSPELLLEGKKYLNQKIKRPYTIVYYHLDTLFTNRFTLEDLL